MPLPPHPSLLVLGYSEAGLLLSRPNPPQISALISIHGHHEHPLDPPQKIPLRLDLTFDDIDPHDPTDPISTYHAIQRDRRNAELGLQSRPPNPQDVQAIIHFAKSIQALPGPLLLHCGAGISRSPAAALICLATWTLPGEENICMSHLLSLRPAAQPHPALIRYADALLSRQGQLLQSLNPPQSQSSSSSQSPS